VLGLRTLQLAELFRSPDKRNILLRLDSIHSAGNVSTHAICVIPKGAFFVEEIQPVVREEVGFLGQALEKGVDLVVEFVDGAIGDTGIRYHS
jgi:hypothetical protein